MTTTTAALIAVVGTGTAAWMMLRSIWDYIDGDGSGHLVAAVIAGAIFIYMLTAAVLFI